MSLFTDGVATRIDNLKAYESSILDVASLEAIDISVKLELAHLELGFDLSAFLNRSGSDSTKLNNIVFSDLLAHAECLKTLELIYCDAYNSQVNDRYQGKWRNYALRYEKAIRLALESGLGVISAPLPRPSKAAVAVVSGGVLPALTYYVAIALENSMGHLSALSEVTLIDTAANQLLSVASPTVPSGAVGWTIYAGLSEDSLHRQTLTPLPAGSRWTQDLEGLRFDIPAAPMQTFNRILRNRRILSRG